MKRLLLDQGLPRTAAVLLREQGLEVRHVGEIGMAKAADAEILDYVLGVWATKAGSAFIKRKEGRKGGVGQAQPAAGAA